MKSLKELVLESAEKAQQVDEGVKELIVQSEKLKKISEQVNILSLNVQIEASRIDGEEGRVVDIIGKQMNDLGKMSAEIMKDIERVSKSLNVAMEEVKEIVMAQVELVNGEDVNNGE